MSQSQIQQSIRAVTGTSYFYEDDWHALFDLAGVADGFFNERLLRWLNMNMADAYTTLADAQRAFAALQSVSTWGEIGTFTPQANFVVNDAGEFVVNDSGQYVVQ